MRTSGTGQYFPTVLRLPPTSENLLQKKWRRFGGIIGGIFGGNGGKVKGHFI